MGGKMLILAVLNLKNCAVRYALFVMAYEGEKQVMMGIKICIYM
jgi:hypothetical protein